jgi:hypothetical protein
MDTNELKSPAVVDAAELDDLGKLKALAIAVPEHIQLNGWYVEAPRFGHQHVYADNFKGHGRQHIATLPAAKGYFGTMADFIAAANPAAILRIAALVAQQAARIAELENGDAAPALVVPEGMALVPLEPTADMIYAGSNPISTAHKYKAMLAAAPTVPAPSFDMRPAMLSLACVVPFQFQTPSLTKAYCAGADAMRKTAADFVSGAATQEGK